MKGRVHDAAERQRSRYAETRWERNGALATNGLRRHAPLGTTAQQAWRDVIEQRGLTGRGATAVWRVARTLADLDGVADIGAQHLERAVMMRQDVP